MRPAAHRFMGPQADHPQIETRCREYCVVDLYDARGVWTGSLFCLGDKACVRLDLRRLARHLAASEAMILLLRHGHPSGRADPSDADIETTRALISLARLLGMRLHDHVIEAGPARFSFREAGLL